MSPLQSLRLMAYLLIAFGIHSAAQAQPDAGLSIDRKTEAAIIDSTTIQQVGN